MDYKLSSTIENKNVIQNLSPLLKYLNNQLFGLIFATIGIIINSATAIVTPYVIALAIDDYIANKNIDGLTPILIFLSIVYIINAILSYFQTRIIGRISQQALFRLKNDLFEKIQQFRINFFIQNKAGDIINRVNSDTEKVNNFLSGSIFQFVASFFNFVGIGIFVFFLNYKLGLVVWIAVVFVLIINYTLSNVVSRANTKSLQDASNITSFLDENLYNFKAIIAFNKTKYFDEKFAKLNKKSFDSATKAQSLNDVYRILYSFAGNIAQVLVLVYGFSLLQSGEITTGLLISFISYTQKFYDPLRTLGSIWGTILEASYAFTRISEILKLK
jgi:ATP-binding cassette subfamily B protein